MQRNAGTGIYDGQTRENFIYQVKQKKIEIKTFEVKFKLKIQIPK